MKLFKIDITSNQLDANIDFVCYILNGVFALVNTSRVIGIFLHLFII